MGTVEPTVYVVAEHRNGGWALGDYQVECDSLADARATAAKWNGAADTEVGIFALVRLDA